MSNINTCKLFIIMTSASTKESITKYCDTLPCLYPDRHKKLLYIWLLYVADNNAPLEYRLPIMDLFHHLDERSIRRGSNGHGITCFYLTFLYEKSN